MLSCFSCVPKSGFKNPAQWRFVMRVKSLITNMMLVVLIGANLTSCASIVSGRTQRIPINSYPEGATVYVDGRMAGFTPTSVIVDRDHSHNITLAREGYQPTAVRLRPRVNPVIAGNVVSGLAVGLVIASIFPPAGFIAATDQALLGCFAAGTLVGCVVDCLNGSAYTMSRSSVNIPLCPAQ